MNRQQNLIAKTKSGILILVYTIIFSLWCTCCFSEGSVISGSAEKEAVSESETKAPDDISGEVNVNDIVLSNTSNGSIKGTYIINSSSQNYITNLWASVEIYKIVNDASNLVGKTYYQFEIEAKSKKDLSFEYKLPENIFPGKYFIIGNVLNSTGVPISTPKKEELNLEGNSKVLIYNPSEKKLVLVDSKGEKVYPLTGPTYKAKVEPELFVEYANYSNAVLKGYPKISVYKRSKMYSEFKPILVKKGPEYTFLGTDKEGRGTIQNIIVKLPGMTEPESYFAEMVFVDEKDIPISYPVEMRYIVEGINGKIINSNARAESGFLNINTLLIGSADGSKVENALIKTVILLESSKKQIASSEQKVTLLSELTQNVSKINVNMSTDNLIVKTTLEKDGVILDSNTIKYDVKKIIKTSLQPGIALKETPIDYAISEMKEKAIPKSSRLISLLYVFVAILLVAVIIAGYIYYKKKNNVRIKF